jgi:hypothetical protein
MPPTFVLPDVPSDTAAWARLDDATVRNLMQDALVDLAWSLMNDPDPEVRVRGAASWPQIVELVERRWLGAYELAKREAAGVRPS